MTPLLKKLILVAVILLAVMVGFEQNRKLSGPTVPDFRGKTLEGDTFALAEHRGKRPVLISFYATWCGPCQMEVEHLTRLSQEYGDRGLQVVVLTAEPSQLIKAHPIMARAPFTIIPDAQATFEQFKVGSIPHSFFLKPSGQVFEMKGYSNELMQTCEEEIKSTLGATSARS